MGLRSWLLERTRRTSKHDGCAPSAAGEEADAAGERRDAPGPSESGWQEVPAFLPVNPQEHTVPCVIASAIAAGDRPESELRIRRVSVANPEHRRVAIVATALAAGALESSAFTVKRIYKKDEEGSHAA